MNTTTTATAVFEGQRMTARELFAIVEAIPAEELFTDANVKLRSAVHAAIVRIQDGKSDPTPTYRGAMVRNTNTGTTHFENSWRETFCGLVSLDLSPVSAEGRATCRSCRKAGDSALNDPEYRTGSAARR